MGLNPLPCVVKELWPFYCDLFDDNLKSYLRGSSKVAQMLRQILDSVYSEQIRLRMLHDNFHFYMNLNF